MIASRPDKTNIAMVKDLGKLKELYEKGLQGTHAAHSDEAQYAEFFREIPSRPLKVSLGYVKMNLRGAGNLNDYYFNQLE